MAGAGASSCMAVEDSFRNQVHAVPANGRSPEHTDRMSRRRTTRRFAPELAGGVRSHGFDPDEELLIASASALAPQAAPFWPIAVLAILPRTVRWIAWSIRDRVRRGGRRAGR